VGGLEFVQGAGERLTAAQHHGPDLGYDIVAASIGRVIVKATPTEDHLNPHGTVYGGRGNPARYVHGSPWSATEKVSSMT
jgi:hypothetical protein